MYAKTGYVPCVTGFGTTMSSESGEASGTFSSGGYTSGGESQTVSEESSVASLLDRLRSPVPSELARKRKISTNLPPVGQKRSKCGSASTSLKSVSPRDRVREFTDESLCVSAGKLFCRACREELAVKKSVVKNHVQSVKHESSKGRLKEKEKRDSDIVDALQRYTKQIHPKGETLSDNTRVYRVKVVRAFLRAGVPLQKIDSFRELLEESAFSLSSSQHMRDLIPFIRSEEQRQTMEELRGRDVSVIFDGTTHVAEAMAIVVRCVNSDWTITQRLVRALLVTKSMCGEEVARELIAALSITLGIASGHLLAAMRDRCSVNGVAMRTLKVVYPEVLDVGCFSHALDLVGKKFKTPNLDDFSKHWVALFAHSPKARIAWKARTGVSVRTYSETRWWSRWEVLEQVQNLYGDIEGFLKDSDMAPATKEKLLTLLSHPQKCVLLKMELAAVIDAGRPLVQATYVLEGDGPLLLQCYEEVSKVSASFSTGYYPNVNAVAQATAAESGNPAFEQTLIDYANQCIRPAKDYFEEKFDAVNGELGAVVSAFKAARLFSPHKASEMRPSTVAVDQLEALPFLSDKLDDLKLELPLYIAAAEDVSNTTNALEWWKMNETKLPHWAAACKRALLVQPSSAAVERVFSLLNNSFSKQQEHSMEDYIEASLMLQYNDRV